MPSSLRFWGLPVMAGLLGLLSLGCRQHSQPTSNPAGPPQLSPHSDALLTGTASCSGRGCHASIEPGPSLSRSSYSRWLHHDPHANAFTALLSERARKMG